MLVAWNPVAMISSGTLRLRVMSKSFVDWWVSFYYFSKCCLDCTRRYVLVAQVFGYCCLQS